VYRSLSGMAGCCLLDMLLAVSLYGGRVFVYQSRVRTVQQQLGCAVSAADSCLLLQAGCVLLAQVACLSMQCCHSGSLHVCMCVVQAPPACWPPSVMWAVEYSSGPY
jgi:hypothetical protein